MDESIERHWWFASKLQETFHFGGYDNPTLLEDFLSEPEVVELINDFLSPGEPYKLFFYCDASSTTSAAESRSPSAASRRLHVTAQLTEDVVSRKGRVCLYVLRKDVGGEVDVSQMERELYCGELRHSVLSSLASLLTEAYAPLLHEQRSWGECSNESVSNFLQNFDRFSNALYEAASQDQIHQSLLQRPGLELRSELFQSQHGRVPLLANVVMECEALITDWIGTIEVLLLETTDERLEDSQGSPMAEMNKWQRRQTVLCSVVEQLKSKECKMILTALVATKSKLLKKWKSIDVQITDAFNNARDRVRYLEALSPHLEVLQASPAPSPSNVTASILPGLATAIKQMDGLSRAYARSGYLGILFTKISNALVRVCCSYLEAYASKDDEELFWKLVSESVTSEAKAVSEHPLVARLNACMTMTAAFKELLQKLKDTLLQPHHVSFSTNAVLKASNLTAKKLHSTSSSEQGDSSSTNLAVTSSGVSLQNNEKIAAGLNEFSLRVNRVLDIISTLAQLKQLQGRVLGLPRVAGLWEIDVAGSEYGRSESLGHSGFLSFGTSPYAKHSQFGGAEMDTALTSPDFFEQLLARKTQGPLATLKEESSVMDGGSVASNSATLEEKAGFGDATSKLDNCSTEDSTSCSTPLSTVPREMSDSPNDSVALMLKISTLRILTRLALSCRQGVLDVFTITGKTKTVFPDAYQEYAKEVSLLEESLCLYLQAVFADVKTSKRALDIIIKFDAVSKRFALKDALQKCMLTAFNRYGQELEAIQTTYEKDKSSPPVARNAPPLAGAVAWCRQLLKRVEDPMTAFRDNATVMQSMESLQICKLYNRLATALFQYESLWLNQWKASLDTAKASLSAKLLKQEERDGHSRPIITVNCSTALMGLIAEAKALDRLAIPLPEAAQNVLKQERRIKLFKQKLEHVLTEFYSTQEALDPAVLPLLSSHIEAVVRALLPGWSTLTWMTVNIDAFLHRVESCVATLKELAERMGAILKERVYAVLEKIQASSLFDETLAFSKTWHPAEVSEAVSASVLQRSTEVFQDIVSMQKALVEVINLAAGKPALSSSAEQPRPELRTPNRIPSDSGKMLSRSTRMDSTRSTPQYGYGSSHSRVHSGLLSTRHLLSGGGSQGLDGFTGMQTLSGMGDGAEEMLGHFCGLVFDAVSQTVLKSHGHFYHSLFQLQADVDSARLSEVKDTKRRQKTVTFDISNLEGEVHETKPTPQPSKTVQLVISIHFAIPRIHLEPSLKDVHSHLDDTSSSMLALLHKVTWWVGPNSGQSVHQVLQLSGAVRSLQESILQAIHNMAPGIESCVNSLRLYEFLWKKDLHATYKLFLEGNPQQSECTSRIEDFVYIEEKVAEVPATFCVGPLQLSSSPVKSSLRALAVAWKLKFTTFLHDEAKESLESLVAQRQAMVSQLDAPVESLAQLKVTLELLQQITDLQSLIDGVYTPVENQYALLREYNPYLPRAEVQLVDSLRAEWDALTGLADRVQHQLLLAQRLHYEREVEKQVKAFVVETIQFRNSFDTEGPLVPGLIPNEAVSRLGTFLERSEELHLQRELLDSVQRLLDIPLVPYPELDQTEQDLSFLRTLYSNYQQFISFDKGLRQELWSEVDLDSATQQVEQFWSGYEHLPVEQKEWDASRKLKSEIQQYRRVLPLLSKLHSKEVRNRHWLQVMAVASCTLQLEGSVFKMAHLLDAGLLHHVAAIEEIVKCAQCELQLETQFYAIEEEWSEQVLQFVSYKSHGFVLLTDEHTHSLLEQLEHAQMQLAMMLRSKHILPLRDDTAQWAVKLALISEVLQQWVQVQDLWRNLEAVFSTPSTAAEFPAEVVKFAAIHKHWVALMRRAHDTKNVLQCCCVGGGDTPVTTVLSRINQDLEECKKSLSSYLLSKRQAFPRFHFVSDDSLLSILSNSASVTSLQPHLRSLFASAASLTSSKYRGEHIVTTVTSIEGEQLQLTNPVTLSCGVEEWISQVLTATRTTLQQLVSAAIEHKGSASFSLEECAHQNVAQVAGMALYCQWTQECEHALMQCRYDRRALPGARAKFNTWAVGRLSALLMKNAWGRSGEMEALTPVSRMKLESLTMLSLWMRDVLDDLCHRKLKDVSDFEWQRFLRPYLESESEAGDSRLLVLRCLDQKLSYEYEYYGCQSPPVFTPRTDNYFIAFTQALSSHLGSMVAGPTGAGKVQLVKGIAQLCGRFLFILHCTSLTGCDAIARGFEGIIQDGSWLCVSDVQALTGSAVSLLSQMVYTIATALHSKAITCTVPCGREIAVQPRLAVFLTQTAGPTAKDWHLPRTMAPHFRTFSLPLPDATIVFRAYSSVLGLRAPRILANKLATLQKLTKEQLSPNCAQASLSQHSLCHILSVASKKFMATRKGGQGTRQTPEHSVGFSGTASHSFEQHSHGHGRAHTHEAGRPRKGSIFNANHSPGHHAVLLLPAQAQREHSTIAQLILNIAGSRFPEQEFPVFVAILKDVFGMSADVANMQLEPLIPDLGNLMNQMPTASSRTLSSIEPQELRELLNQQATAAHLVPSKEWSSKVEQLFTMTQLKHGVVLAGEPATGKSAALSTVVSALNAKATQGGGFSSVKLLKIFPGMFGDLSELYGCLNPEGDWVDGVFTSFFRKAHRAMQTVTWVSLDGELHPSWMESLSEMIGPSSTMTLSSGEHLFMDGKSFKLIFETGSLQEASPATLLNCGVVYFDSGVLGWRPVVGAWLATRSTNEAQCLKKYFGQIMDQVVDFVLQKAGFGSVCSEVGLLEACLAYLTTLLNIFSETAEVFSEVHVERLLLFAVIWSYGGVLVREREQRRFSQLLKTLTNSLPDDDSEYSVFDYYVDESGEWDVWKTRLPEERGSPIDLFGSVFVNTTDTVRVEVLLELSLLSHRHAVLVGPYGCGKTTIVRHFLQSRVSSGSNEVMKQSVLNGHHCSASLHSFMQTNFHHRQGYTFGPKHGRSINWFIDDLNLPLRHSEKAGACLSHEYIRQLLDCKGLYCLQKSNEWCAVEDLLIFAALTSASHLHIAPRLQRHFSVIRLPELKEQNLKAIVSQMVTSHLESSSSAEVLQATLSASLDAYSSLKETLKISNSPGRQHYFFSLAQLESVFQGLCHCIETTAPEIAWPHEMKRAFADSLCRLADVQWLWEYIASLTQQYFGLCGNGEDVGHPVALSAVPTELKQGGDQPTSTVSPLNTLPEVALYPVKKWGDLHVSMAHFMRRYREEHGSQINLHLSDTSIKQLVQLHRALKFPKGNVIVVGSIGQPLEQLASFALHITGYSLQPLDCSRGAAFNDGLRALFRQAALEGKPTAVIITEQDIENTEVLQTLNSLIACGELPTLFTNDEMEGLLQALAPSIKRDFPSEDTNPMQYFTARICRNLRLVFCLPPSSQLLDQLAHDYKGLLQSIQLIWMCDWSEESLEESVKHFFSENPVMFQIGDRLRTALCGCLSAIHGVVMHHTGQLIQAGLHPDHSRSHDHQTTASSKPAHGAPTSFDHLIEKMSKLSADSQCSGLQLPYVGPRTKLQFLECFCEIFKCKYSKTESERDNLSKALGTLHNTQQEAAAMKTTLQELKQEHEKASRLSKELMTDLTAKSCQVERLKALLGHGSSVLSAMQMVSEQERQLLENEEDDDELLTVFMDRRSSRLEAKLLRAKEQLATAEREEREAKQAMTNTKEQALHWQSKMDRNTIDQIKSLNNPPRLVGTIMELMLTLLKQYGSSEQTATSDDSLTSTPGNPPVSQPSLSKKRSSGVSVLSAAAETSKMEKEQWNSIQIAIGDSQKFMDLVEGLKWPDGLSPDAVNLIESKLATSASQLPEKSDLSRLPSVSDSAAASKPGGKQPLITVAMARHAAESAAVMCAFAVAIVQYNHSFKPYKLAREKLQRAQHELQELESTVHLESSGPQEVLHKSEPPELADVAEEAEVGEEGLTRLHDEMEQLQQQFDKAVMQKHSLGQTCQQLAEKLKSANNLLESLRARQESWQKRLDSLPTLEVIVTNCILAAAATTYCGPLKTQLRQRLFDTLLHVCCSHGLPPSGAANNLKNVLKLESYPAFMLGETALHHLSMEGLPLDATSQQNACIVSTHAHTRAWPLIIDRLGLAGDWLAEREKKAVSIKYKSAGLEAVVTRCMQEGSVLILTEVDTVALAGNRGLMDVLQCRRRLHKTTSSQKITIDEKEIECSPHFKLFLLTSDQLRELPASVFSLVCTVLFQPERCGVAGLLLDSFLKLQNPKTSHDREQLRKEMFMQAVSSESIEKELLELLAQQDSQVEGAKTTKSVLALNKAFEDAQESLGRACAGYSLMNDVHLSVLQRLASQASVVMDVVFSMASILPAYHTSYHHLQSLFLSFIEQAGSRIQGEDAITRMTRTVYSHLIHGYFEKDRLLFSFLLTSELEISQGKSSKAERDFLIAPFRGCQFTIRGLAPQTASAANTEPARPAQATLTFGKKPFDWMSDLQWQMLLMLASNFAWVHGVIERLSSKEAKETVWRTVGEGIAPEAIDLTEAIGHRLFAMQRLLLKCAMRPERTTQCVISFVSTVLGQKQKRLHYDTPVDANKVLLSCKPHELPLILFRDEPSTPLTKLKQLATKSEAVLTICYLHGQGEDEAASVKTAIHAAACSEGHWLLVHNADTCPLLLAELPAILDSLPARHNWKLFVSLCGDCDAIPMELLQSASKLVLDSPISLRSNVLHSLSSVAGELVCSSSRQEWLPLLHNLAMLHATVQLRQRAYGQAWSTDYHWSHTQLLDVLHYCQKEFRSLEVTMPGLSGVKPVSWTGMRHMISEVFYGALITEPTDASVFAALTEHWIHPGGPRREASRYHIPSQFFVPNTRLNSLLQAVETASPPLVFTAEICCLFFTAKIKLGWECYLFPHLASLSYYLEQHCNATTGAGTTEAPPPPPPPRPMAALTVSAATLSTQSVALHTHSPSTQTIQPSVPTAPIEKLPSFIQVTSQIAEVVLTSVPCEVLRAAITSNDSALLKNLPLQNTIRKLQENTPTPWKKELLIERLKRHGTDTSFGSFMKSETSQMSDCLQGIHSSLQDLQRVLADSSHGDMLLELPHLVELALALLALKVPQHWQLLVGPSAPPGSWPLKEWVQDITLRFVFLDRVLVGGLSKIPTYWLGAFFNPQGFLSILQQNVVKAVSSRTGASEQFALHAELTARDKDHIRDPPPEGEVFVYGVYLWGCGYEKSTTLDLQEVPPKAKTPVSLPLIHISITPKSHSEPAALQQQQQQQAPAHLTVENKGPHTFHCPCFVRYGDRGSYGGEVFTLTVTSNDVTPQKWLTRNLACSLRPF